jgi:hypothetical protein
VGRTARGRDGKGRALLMLMPEELGFLKYLKAAKVGQFDWVITKSTIEGFGLRTKRRSGDLGAGCRAPGSAAVGVARRVAYA